MFFAKKPAVGLDLGSHSLKCSRKGEHWEGELVEDRQTKDDTSPNLTARMGQLTAQHKLTGTVNFTIPGQGTLARYLEMPAKDVKAGAPAKAMEFIPWELDQTNLSFQQVPTLSGEDKMAGLFFVADPKERVKQGLDLLKACGLKVNRMEVPLLSLLRQHPAPEGEVVAHIQCGFTFTHMLILRGKHPYYYRELKAAGRDFTYAFQQGEQCSWADAEKLKRAHDVAERHPQLEPALQQWTRDLQRSVAAAPLKPTRIVFSGGSAHWKGLSQRLGEDLKLPIEVVSEPTWAVADGLAHP